MACKLFDKNIIASGFIDSIDYVLTDCDGVLWLGSKVLPGAIETLKFFREKGKKIIYVTNNSTKSRTEYLQKFHSLGFEASMDEVFSSAYCAALYLKALQFKRKVYVMAMTGVTEELQQLGIEYLPLGPDPIPDDWVSWIRNGVPMDPEVGAVVVGLDVHISYPKLLRAATYINRPGCIYIATNTDGQFPVEGNVTMPGTGSLVAAVSAAAACEPAITGKPSKHMFDCIRLVHPEMKPERCLMIGDRLKTDIVFGRAQSMKTLLVLTGINSVSDAQDCLASGDPIQMLEVPDYYSPSLQDVFDMLQSA